MSEPCDVIRVCRGMTEVKIFTMYSQFLGEFNANFKDSYSLYLLAYSPMCVSRKILILGLAAEFRIMSFPWT